MRFGGAADGLAALAFSLPGAVGATAGVGFDGFVAAEDFVVFFMACSCSEA
jgi:hypothetical protein